MLDKKNGGPAFPYTTKNNSAGDIQLFGVTMPSGSTADFSGMTLRDYFAAKALPVAWSAFQDGYYECEAAELSREVSACAYQLADAMLAAREGKA